MKVGGRELDTFPSSEEEQHLLMMDGMLKKHMEI